MLSLEDLAATAGSDRKNVEKRQRGLEKAKQTEIAVPVATATERRAQREAAYEAASAEAKTWDATTKAEARADRLRFGAREAAPTSTGLLASTFYAETPLERRVEHLLRQGGAADERAVRAKELEALEAAGAAEEADDDLATEDLRTLAARAQSALEAAGVGARGEADPAAIAVA
eukprot:CAMPEP_0119270822 /NCGR_PEP_ID=MMETSP1329-20130426/7672_1 /TAXON_ID=114041 /ORGANISM="Genus nov. species nov., Strain RCC1024" /LENGTH=174 /DNA_ID=CAMNT_0007270853 /DNA_START=137 /DNA_END=657 /DNA_ORIENTATION=-